MRSRVIVFLGIVISLVACNFIVDAEFNDKILPGQEGGVNNSACPLGNAPKDPACANCMLTACKTEYDNICKDGNNAQGKLTLGDCVDDPSVKSGNCERVWVDAGTEQQFSDPQTHYFNMRVCATANCKSACTTCTGLTYDRYAGDNMPPPIETANTTCSKCLLANCQSALVGGGTKFSNCCYQDRIDETWGPCLRPQSPDCSGIKMWAANDGGSGGCDYTLAKCAVDNCKGACSL